MKNGCNMADGISSKVFDVYYFSAFHFIFPLFFNTFQHWSSLSSLLKSFYLCLSCRLSVCPCCNSRKCTWITTSLIYVIEVYRRTFPAGSELCSVYSITFIWTYKIFPLHYGLWWEIVYSAFQKVTQ